MSKDTGGSAYPYHDGHIEGEIDSGSHGMTLRDYFAAKAMSAYIDRSMLLNCKTDDEVENEFINTAAFAYRMADAMLEARK